MIREESSSPSDSSSSSDSDARGPRSPVACRLVTNEADTAGSEGSRMSKSSSSRSHNRQGRGFSAKIATYDGKL